MRLNEFVSNHPDPRTLVLDEKLSESQVLNIINSKCSEALDMAKQGHKLYRGINLKPSVSYCLIDPNITPRSSAMGAKNYYTVLMDNLPSWAGYPKRSRSLICSSSHGKAGNFGDVYLVLPFNGANLGVFWHDDIWAAKVAGQRMVTLNSFYARYGVFDESYEKLLITMLVKLPNMAQAEYSSNYNGPFDAIWFNGINQVKTVQDLEHLLDEMYNPKKCNFSKISINRLPDSNTKPVEIWTDSKAILINTRSEFYRNLLYKAGSQP